MQLIELIKRERGGKDYGGTILISTQRLRTRTGVEIPKNRVLYVLNGEVFILSSRI